jgi:hypothetical protein
VRGSRPRIFVAGRRTAVDRGVNFAVLEPARRRCGLEQRYDVADSVAKRFCSSGRARSIQDRAPMRNVDSKIHAARFDRFKFLFHSFGAATFATISTRTEPERSKIVGRSVQGFVARAVCGVRHRRNLCRYCGLNVFGAKAVDFRHAAPSPGHGKTLVFRVKARTV